MLWILCLGISKIKNYFGIFTMNLGIYLFYSNIHTQVIKVTIVTKTYYFTFR